MMCQSIGSVLQRLRIRRLLFATLLSGAIGVNGVQAEVMVIEGARIRGNQESPNVLFVVPWRALEQSLPDATEGELIHPRRTDPLYRGEFVRLIEYHEQFKAVTAAEDSAAASDGPDSANQGRNY